MIKAREGSQGSYEDLEAMEMSEVILGSSGVGDKIKCCRTVWTCCIRVERVGYVLSEHVLSVEERLSSRSCSSAVAWVLSGGDEATVNERYRPD